MTDKTAFKRGFGDVLKRAGFRNKGPSWFRDGDDSIVVLNLQKSDFDEKYYVNFGVWLKDLGESVSPSPSSCHIQSRLPSLFSRHAEMIERACSLGSSDEEFAAFVAFLHASVVPFCESCLTRADLRQHLATGRFEAALVMKAARSSLGVD